MSKERPLSPEAGFAFSENEQLYNRVTQSRFEQLLADDATAIHRLELAANSFGEFLFVTASRPTQAGRQAVSFYGLGFHEYRERWLQREWYWYTADLQAEQMEHKMDKDEALEILRQRRAALAPYFTTDAQTHRGQLYELLADLLDEDGALSELQDWEGWDED